MTEVFFSVKDQEYHTTFHALDAMMYATLQLAIVHGLAVGCGVVILIISWLIITNRRTPMFILNQFTIILMVIRSGFYLGFLLGPINSLTYRYTGQIDHKWNQYNISITADVLHTLLVALVEATLVFQIYVVFKSSNTKTLGKIFTVVASALGLCIFALYVNATVIEAKQLKDQLKAEKFTVSNSWVNNVPVIMFSASLNVICIILITKLVAAVRMRRHLGLKQFDAFHILIIMATQTLFIPSVLMIVNYHQSSSYSSLLANISIVLVVLNLPFSSLWASSANNSPMPSSSPNTVFFKASSRLSDLETLASKSPSPLKKFSNVVMAPEYNCGGDTLSTLESDHDSIDKYINGNQDIMMTEIARSV